MSQDDIDFFIQSAYNDTLLPEGVATAVLERGIPVNGRHSHHGATALHWAVHRRQREVVVALLAAGADANVKDKSGWTSVWWAADDSTAEIMQMLLDSGGNVREPDNDGETPLIALVRNRRGDAAARLGVLLARHELDLDAKYYGKTAEEWAVDCGYPELEAPMTEERLRRGRWSELRSAWVAATIALSGNASNDTAAGPSSGWLRAEQF
jgi:hypothetical protein